MSIANQSISQLGGPLSVLSLQKRDHVRLGELSRRLVDTPAAGQKAVLLDIYRLAFPHAFAEEAVLWPLIRRVLPDGDAVSLQAKTTALQQRLAGIAWEVVRWIAPTRAHPIVARRPPGNLLSALPLALIDRLRDGVDARLYSGGADPSGRLSALSTALEQASRAVERLPGMRSGEDPATRVPAKPRSGWAALAMVTIAAGATAMALRTQRSA